MFPNVKPSEQVAVIGQFPPQSQAAGTAVTGWVDGRNFNKYLAILSVGAFGASATVDATVTQATDSSGTGAKAFSPAKAITQQLAAGGNNKVVEIQFDAQDFDVENSFCFFQVNIPVGTAATIIGCTVLGFVPRNAPASDFNAAGVVTQIYG